MSGYISHIGTESPSEDIRVESDGKTWWYNCTKCSYRNDRKYHAKMHFLRCHVNGARGCRGRRKYQDAAAPVQKKMQHTTPPASLCCVRVAGMKYTHTKRMVRESVRGMAKFQPANAMVTMTFRETHVETNSATAAGPYIRGAAETDT